jgi:hypothetical protein
MGVVNEFFCAYAGLLVKSRVGHVTDIAVKFFAQAKNQLLVVFLFT